LAFSSTCSCQNSSWLLWCHY